MRPQEEAFNHQVNNVMTHRWLVHALNKWLKEQDRPTDTYNLEQVYLAAKDAIQNASTEDRMEDMLDKAKESLKNEHVPTETETMGAMFHEWLAKEDLDIPKHPRRAYTLAAILNDVQQALPSASISDKLEAIKALWSAHRMRLLNPETVAA